MCSAEHARRTSCHPDLVPLRCCLRLCETTPVPLPQVLPLLAQCAPGILVLSTSKSGALYKSLHASRICYHARLVKVKNASADVSERQALSNLIRCSRSRNPIMKYDSLSTLMSRVDVGLGASLA